MMPGSILGVQPYEQHHEATADSERNPVGGYSRGNGFNIDWSKTNADTILAAVIDRLKALQLTSANSPEKAMAISKGEEMQGYLTRGHQDRMARGLE